MKQNPIKEKSYEFALKVVRLCIDLRHEMEFVLSKQLLRAGTSTGANEEEGLQAESRADFIHKLSIAQKESFETHYWPRLLRDSSLVPTGLTENLVVDC